MHGREEKSTSDNSLPGWRDFRGWDAPNKALVPPLAENFDMEDKAPYISHFHPPSPSIFPKVQVARIVNLTRLYNIMLIN